jgi:regulator of G-protein signaling
MDFLKIHCFLNDFQMESLIKEMQDPEHGVPVRSQKLFLSSVPAAFAGYDIIEWLMERMSIEDSGMRGSK